MQGKIKKRQTEQQLLLLYYIVDKKNLIPAFIALELVTGQKTQLTSARKSIAPFKIRENQALGCKITLRKSRLYNFLNYLNEITCFLIN